MKPPLRPWLAACLLIAFGHAAWADAGPVFSETGPDAAAWVNPTGSWAEAIALWQALVARYAP